MAVTAKWHCKPQNTFNSVTCTDVPTVRLVVNESFTLLVLHIAQNICLTMSFWSQPFLFVRKISQTTGQIVFKRYKSNHLIGIYNQLTFGFNLVQHGCDV